jgi:hypothetical protein
MNKFAPIPAVPDRVMVFSPAIFPCNILSGDTDGFVHAPFTVTTELIIWLFVFCE